MESLAFPVSSLASMLDFNLRIAQKVLFPLSTKASRICHTPQTVASPTAYPATVSLIQGQSGPILCRD